jgi:hypothetical protein
MKTATISIFHAFGSIKLGGADIFYRGNIIGSINAKGSLDEVERKAILWATAHGFTNTKLANH